MTQELLSIIKQPLSINNIEWKNENYTNMQQKH
jgi:hypothetical protein